MSGVEYRVAMPAEHDHRSTAATIGVVTLLLSVGAMLWWSIDHRFPVEWDEANYVNYVLDDHRRFVEGGFTALAKSYLFADRVRPPAYRVFALGSATGIFDQSVTTLRLHSAAAFLLCAALLHFAAGGGAAGWWTVAFFSASPAIVNTFLWFGTEFPLFFATAILLVALMREWKFGALTAILAIALTIGALSKITFFAVAGPAVLAWLLSATKQERRARVAALAIASVVCLLIAGPWWGWNYRLALEYAQYGRTFPRAAVAGTFFSEATTKAFVLLQAIGPLTPGRRGSSSPRPEKAVR